MGEPAHDQPVGTKLLHPVDADIDVERIARRGRDDQRPCHQWRRLSRPTGLDRQPVEVDLAVAPDDILARRARYGPASQGKGGHEMTEISAGVRSEENTS